MAPGVTIGTGGFVARREHFATVGSTNDVIRGWLATGTPEVCVAVADEQTAGRGREGRSWIAPPGAALLASLGFRPTWLAPDRAWRLAALVSLAMADAAEDVAGLAEGTIRLKWPNDLVVIAAGDGARIAGDPTAEEARALTRGEPSIRKLGGVLGETSGIGTAQPTAIVGIGVNADWQAAAFPPDLADAMTSLREASGGRPIDREALLDGFLDRIETRIEALRGGRFDVADWAGRQLTTGREVRLETPDGRAETVRALGVDPSTGALVVEGERQVFAGEIRHLRLGGTV